MFAPMSPMVQAGAAAPSRPDFEIVAELGRCSCSTRDKPEQMRGRKPRKHKAGLRTRHRGRFSMADVYVGIDVAKASLDVHVRPANEVFTFPNDEAGFAQLVRELRKRSPALIVLEATGNLEAHVTAALGVHALP